MAGRGFVKKFFYLGEFRRWHDILISQKYTACPYTEFIDNARSQYHLFDFSYYEISGPDICSLIYESHPQLYPLVAILKPLLTVYQHENYGCIFRSVEISSCVHRNSASFLMHLECMGYICLHNFMRLFFPKKYAWNQDLVSCISQALEVLYG